MFQIGVATRMEAKFFLYNPTDHGQFLGHRNYKDEL